ncbi:sensor histidine kinase [Pedobacter duraquae]|uniref:Histidine kinase n=1 Tax=Pedobacter duraquae TaxID=425511 RepID=A0A4R6IQG5_9SPHI|nr:histidine kinase [Pedobacter duraquae]TDO24572.1 histidine kinase [Pedobacter duraquae]
MITALKDENTTKITLKDWIFKKRFHFYGWSVFLFYEIIVVGLYSGHFGHPVRYLINYGLNISLFYFHAHVALGYGLRDPNGAIWKVPGLLATEIFCYLLLAFSSQWLMFNYSKILEEGPIKFDDQFYLAAVFRSCYFIVFSTGYYFLKTYLEERKKTEELENNRLKNLVSLARSENAHLRSQINPHFLFNTLDFIYHNALDKAPAAAEGISLLSGIMRYAVESSCEAETVKLSDEISQAELLINIHQLKADYLLNIRLWYDDDILNVKIIPLMLITLVENMFKHGDLLQAASPGTIRLTIVESTLVVETRNPVSFYTRPGTLKSGLENIRKRLNYTYGETATFVYGLTDETHFTTRLTIPV